MKRLLIRVAGIGLITGAAVIVGSLFGSATLGGPGALAVGDATPVVDPNCTPVATPTFLPGIIQAFQALPSPTPCATQGPPKTHTPTPQTPTSTPAVTNTPPPVPTTPPPAATSTPAGGAGGGVTPPDTGSGGSTQEETPLAALVVAAAMIAAGGATLAVARKVSR